MNRQLHCRGVGAALEAEQVETICVGRFIVERFVEFWMVLLHGMRYELFVSVTKNKRFY